MFKTAFAQGSRAALEKFALSDDSVLSAILPLVAPSAAGSISAYHAPSGEKSRAGLFTGAGSLLGELGGAAGGASLGTGLAENLARSGHPGLGSAASIASLIAGGLLGSAAGGYAGHNLARATSDAPDYMWQR
jgi:hypothetical protein